MTDHGACRQMLAGYVSRVEDNAVEDLLAMLNLIVAEVRRRNAAGGDHSGWLLLFEEYQDPRAAASKDQRKRLDTSLARIIRMGRAVAVHVKILTQRPSVQDVPSSARHLVDQRVCLKLRNAADASLVLGTTSTLDLPKGRGQAIFTDGGELTAVTLDRLTDAYWAKVCQRAQKLRAARPALPVGAADDTQKLPVRSTDPLLDAAVAVLAATGSKGLPATELYSRLPDWARAACPDALALGKYLGRHPSRVTRVHAGYGLAWILGSDSSARVL